MFCTVTRRLKELFCFIANMRSGVFITCAIIILTNQKSSSLVVHYEGNQAIGSTSEKNLCTSAECNISGIINGYPLWYSNYNNGCFVAEMHISLNKKFYKTYVKSSLNLSADPCSNFYEFACGGWIHNHPVPPEKSYINQFRIAEDKLHVELKGLLEKDEVTDPTPVRAASLFYRSCINTDRIEKESVHQLSNLLNKYGGWPIITEHWDENKFDWLHTTSNSIRNWSVMSLFYIYVGLDRQDSNQSVITIDQATSVLPISMMLEPDTYKIQLEAYKQWIAASALLIAKYSNQSVTIKSVEKHASDIILFEIELAKLKSSNEMRKNQFRTYNRMTLRNLQEWTNSAVPESLFKIDWLRLIRFIFEETGYLIDYKEPIIVKEVDYLFHLSKLLYDTPRVVLANYLHWRLVKTVSRDVNDEMRAFVTQFEQVFSGTTSNEPRWKDCIVSVTNMLGFAVGYKYVQKYFDDESKTAATNMVGDILSTFTEHITHTEWMDEKSRILAVDKANSMRQFIGYPEWYHNQTALIILYDGVTVGANHFANVQFLRMYMYKQALLKLRQMTDRMEWVTGPAIVNAFNNGFVNAIILPAGILQLPFFDSKRPSALNYGSIGAIIGHEILHGFDDTGRLLDKYGNLAQWWTEETISAYENKSQCYVNQYNKFIMSEIDSVNGTSLSVNGIITQGENIADNCGLRQTYYAYQKYVQHRGIENSLPGLEQFTANQLFFISYAMTWCESSTKQSLLQEVLDDRHSPHKVRVIATLSNSPEFASAFSCPENSPMNPDHKCIIW